MIEGARMASRWVNGWPRPQRSRNVAINHVWRCEGAFHGPATAYGTTLRSAPCSAHAGMGLLRSFPRTPSNVLPSSGP